MTDALFGKSALEQQLQVGQFEDEGQNVFVLHPFLSVLGILFNTSRISIS